MGQIQNSLNQMFASALALGVGANRSPYLQGQQKIKEAKRKVGVQEMNLNNIGTSLENTILEQIEKAPTLEDLKNINMAEVPNTFKKAEEELKSAEKSMRETIYAHGSSSQAHQAQIQQAQIDAREMLNPYIGREYKESSKNIITSLMDAYDAKRGVLAANEERRKLAENAKKGATPIGTPLPSHKLD